MYSSSNKKQNTPIYFVTNERTEMKLVPIIMDYCLLQFDALNFFFRVRLHGVSLLNFNFFNKTPKIFQRNRKVHLFVIFTTFLTLFWELFDVGILADVRFYEETFFSSIKVVWIKLNEENVNFILTTKIQKKIFSC